MAYHFRPHRHPKPNSLAPTEELIPRYAARYRENDQWIECACNSLEAAVQECNQLATKGYEAQLMILFDFQLETSST